MDLSVRMYIVNVVYLLHVSASYVAILMEVRGLLQSIQAHGGSAANLIFGELSVIT